MMPFRIRSVLALACAATLLPGCESLRLQQSLSVAPSDATTDGGSNARSNVSEQAPPPPLGLRWEYTTEGGFSAASPLVAGRHVLTASRAGNVDVLDLATGTKVGRVSLGEAIEGAPVLVDGRLLVVPIAAGKDGLVAFNLTTGAKTWALRQNWHAAGLLLSGDIIVAAAIDGTVRGIQALNGAELWSIRPDSTRALYASPVEIQPGVAAIADDGGGVFSLDVRTGEMRWRVEIGLPVTRAPSFSGGILFVPTTQGSLVALNALSGEIVWRFSAATPLVRLTTPAVRADALFVGGSDGILRRLHPASGEELWTRQFDGAIAAAPLLGADAVYVGTLTERLAAVDPESGDVLWEDRLPGRAKSAMVARDGILIVLAEPKFVLAYDARRVAARPDGN